MTTNKYIYSLRKQLIVAVLMHFNIHNNNNNNNNNNGHKTHTKKNDTVL